MKTTWKQVVYDTAEAYREATGTSNKIPVGQLPGLIRQGTGGGGTENLDAELALQETLLAEQSALLEGKAVYDVQEVTLDPVPEGSVHEFYDFVASKVTLNPFQGNTGLYVWGRYDRGTISLTQYDSYLQASSSDIDLSAVDGSFFWGLTTTMTISGASYSMRFEEGNVLKNLSSGSTYNYQYDPTTQRFNLAFTTRTWANMYVKRVIDYVVSDEISTYPDGETVDGVWYELADDGFYFTDILGYSRYSISTFAFSARTAVNNSVTHPITGEIPKFAMIVAKQPVFTNNDLYLAIGVKDTDSNNGVISIAQQFVRANSADQKISKYNVQFGVNRNASANIFLDATNIYYAAGVEYYLIVAL